MRVIPAGLATNPVLRRELTERWRGRRAFVLFSLYGAFLGLMMWLQYVAGRSVLDDRFGFGFFGGGLDPGPAMGRFMFENLLALVLMLVLFITPGYAAAQISGERERQTLSLLQVTRVSPLQIVLGKLGASVAWVLLLVVAAIPFGAAAFFLGGVAVSDMLRSVAVVLVVAICVAAMGLGISSMARRTTTSVVMTYGLVLFLVLGTAIGALIEGGLRNAGNRNAGNSGETIRPVLMYANPYVALADASRADLFEQFGELPSVLGPIGSVLRYTGSDQVVFGEDTTGGFRGGVVEVPVPLQFEGPFVGPQVDVGFEVQNVVVRRTPVWLIGLGLYLALGLAGLFVAVRRVRPGAVP